MKTPGCAMAELVHKVVKYISVHTIKTYRIISMSVTIGLGQKTCAYAENRLYAYTGESCAH